MERHLHRLVKLGVDYVWLCPMYPSPGFDQGYDVSDHKAIDPRFGSLQDFDDFVKTAHYLGIGVIMELILNHTSTAHQWFRNHPDYYCWSDSDWAEWHNLFDDGPAWEEYHDTRDLNNEGRNYYLHTLDKTKADLNWFSSPTSEINYPLLQEFKDIIRFWVEEHGVDGFHLDFPQGINKMLEADKLEIADLIWGERMDDVIEALFDDPGIITKTGKKPFLIAEFFDPTPCALIGMASEHLPCIDFFLNPLIKGTVLDKNPYLLTDCIEISVKNPKFILDLESHDSPRFTSLSDLSAREIIDLMFESDANAVCLYQGQELGAYNPIWSQLNDETILSLDPTAAMRHKKGENLSDIRKYSCANNRVRISLTDYAIQEGVEGSILEYTKTAIKNWKSEN
jgi:glycosidase